MTLVSGLNISETEQENNSILTEKPQLTQRGIRGGLEGPLPQRKEIRRTESPEPLLIVMNGRINSSHDYKAAYATITTNYL